MIYKLIQHFLKGLENTPSEQLKKIIQKKTC